MPTANAGHRVRRPKPALTGWPCAPGLAALLLVMAGCGAAATGGGKAGSGESPDACFPDSEPADCCPEGETPIFDSQSSFAGCAGDSGLLEDADVGAAQSKRTGEPNGTFSQALLASYDGDGVVQLRGSIEQPGDLDVYELGPLSPGDRLIVEVEGLSEFFDVSVAVFDQNLSLFMDNDDVDTATGQYDSHFDEIVRHEGDPYYLAVSHSAFAGAGWEVGNYRVTVSVERAQQAPAARSQVLFLDFAGGTVEPDNLLTKTLPPFEAGAIDEVYFGQDDQIKAAIIDSVVENFETYDVTVISDAALLPAGQPHSTVMLGGWNARAFGISESVDHYNTEHGDIALIFTEAFDPLKFTATPSAQALGLAIGNIAAHEAGHLLGLNHVEDPEALMDGASPADTFLADQVFRIGPLSSDVLPIGNQDAPQLLSEIVGLLPGSALKLPRPAPTAARTVRLKESRPISWCGTCNPYLAR